MIESLPADLIELLKELGHAIDVERPFSVFQGGRVGFEPDEESELLKYVPERTLRSSARSQQGQRAPRRSRRRPPAETYPFSSRALEDAFGVQFRVLAQHYEALASEDQNGLWVAIKLHPLGARGPKTFFLVGMPLDARIAPRAWAFGSIGANAALLPLRHSNFPDASICAFTEAQSIWKREDGLLPLVDMFSTWVVKKWHFEKFGWWPGPQVGACALYRRMESKGQEWCGCMSGRRYGDCHQAVDFLVDDSIAASEFRHLFMCDYQDRSVPSCVLEAAKSRWKKLPTLALAFSYRIRPDEPLIPFGSLSH
jgi:hypothetical protein